MSIEEITARQLVHQERTAAILQEFDGLHPDHHALREAVRVAVYEAIDAVTLERFGERGKRMMSDGELPELFRTLDGISSRLFLKSAGLT